jgi:hypothetical protein
MFGEGRNIGSRPGPKNAEHTASEGNAGRVGLTPAADAGHQEGIVATTPTPSSGPSTDRAEFDLAPVVPLASQAPARLVVDAPLPEQLARGLVVVRYRTENLRIVPVFGPAALGVSPRIGHLHVTLDDAPWHWVDASSEPLIVQGLPPGRHRLLIELADPTHKVIDRATVDFEIP